MITFIHPGALWLLALCAIPPLLHLINRLPPQRIRFPMARFLPPAPARRHSRRVWRDRLLLALRTAMLAAGALAFAAPQWQPQPEALASAMTRTAVILDDSASMGTPRRWREALRFLQEAIAAADGECRIFATSGKSYSAAEAHKGQLQAANAPGDCVAAIRHALSWLAVDGLSRRQLVVVSDLQRPEWERQLPAGGLGLRVAVRQMPLPAGNVGIMSAQCDAASRRMSIRVHNYGRSVEKRQLRLQINGRQIGEREITLPPGQSVNVRFLREDPPGWQDECTAQILPGDELPHDDRRVFTLSDAPPEVVVATAPGTDAALMFLQAAFTADGAGACVVRAIPVDELPPCGPSACRAVVLATPPSTRDAISALHGHLDHGGLILHIPETMSPASWRAMNAAGLIDSLPLGMTAQSTGIAAVAPGSTLQRIFPDGDLPLLWECTIRRHLRLQMADNAASVLTLEDGDTALLCEPHGNGQVYAFTFGIGRGDSDLPLSSAFLPILREIIADGRTAATVTAFSDAESTLDCQAQDRVVRMLTTPAAPAAPPITSAAAIAPRDLRPWLAALAMFCAIAIMALRTARGPRQPPSANCA